MNKYLATVGVLIATALFTTTTSVNAAEDTTYRASVDAWKASNKATKEAYKVTLDSFKAGKQDYRETKKAINGKFKVDNSALRASIKSAVDAATTAEAKKAIRVNGKVQLDASIAARNAAIAALAKPTKPTKSTKTSKPEKSAGN